MPEVYQIHIKAVTADVLSYESTGLDKQSF